MTGVSERTPQNPVVVVGCGNAALYAAISARR